MKRQMAKKRSLRPCAKLQALTKEKRQGLADGPCSREECIRGNWWRKARYRPKPLPIQQKILGNGGREVLGGGGIPTTAISYNKLGNET